MSHLVVYCLKVQKSSSKALKIFWRFSIAVSKKQNFIRISNPLKSCKKRKSPKKVFDKKNTWKNVFFTWLFKFFVYKIDYLFFENVGAKFVQMGQKGKNAFYECVLDSNLTSYSAVVVSIFPRKVRIIAPYFTSRLAADIGKYGTVKSANSVTCY